MAERLKMEGNLHDTDSILQTEKANMKVLYFLSILFYEKSN